MKKNMPYLILVACIAFAWVAGVGSALSSSKTAEDVEARIAECEELKTYKNALELYDQMIAEHPEDVSWYERKANAYYEMESYSQFVSLCESMIEKFPDSPVAYERLLSYYDETNRVDQIFSLYAETPDQVRESEKVAAVYDAHEYDTSYASPSFESVGPIRNGHGVVESDGCFGYVDETGSVSIECDFAAARPFAGDTAAVQKDGEWFLIDEEGDRIQANRDRIEDLYSPSEGLALAKVEGVWGYYDEQLKNPAHFDYEDATSFCNGIAAVKKDGKWALIDESFNEVTPFQFDEVVVDDARMCSKEERVLASLDGSYQLFDLEGNRVGDGSFDDAKPFFGGFAAVAQGDAWGFVDADGSMAVDCSFDGAESFRQGIAAVAQGDAWGFVDESGQLVVQPEYSKATVVSDKGVVGVGVGESMRYIQFYKYGF